MTIVRHMSSLIGEYPGNITGAGSTGASSRPSKMTSESARAEAKLTSSLLGGVGFRDGAKGGSGESQALGRGAPKLHLNALLDTSSSSSLSRGRGAKGDYFGDGDDDDGGDDDEGLIDIHMLEFDAQADAKTMNSMLESLDLKNVGAGAGAGAGAKADSKGGFGGDNRGGDIYGGDDDNNDDDDDDDLLALMDGAK